VEENNAEENDAQEIVYMVDFLGGGVVYGGVNRAMLHMVF
jgi:hypothetical protein